jgi:hypothetical protein
MTCRSPRNVLVADGERAPLAVHYESLWIAPGNVDNRTVGRSDGSDDGQAEAMSVFVVRAVGVEPLERLEEPVPFARRDYRSGVGDREHIFFRCR